MPADWEDDRPRPDRLSWLYPALLASCLIAIAISLGCAFAADGWYISGQAGGSRMSGNATQSHVAEDARPWIWNDGFPENGVEPYKVVDTSGIARIAVGRSWDRFGLELGVLPLVGKYHRSADYSWPGRDTVGETIGPVYGLGSRTMAVDVRQYLYIPISSRLTAYGFAAQGVVWYSRNVWTGHYTAADGTLGWNYPKDAGYEEVVSWWRTENRSAFQYGGGLGAEYRLTHAWSATLELAGMFGELRVQSVQAGLRFYF
jgi:opacity protein-like surface antigen